MSYKVGKIKRGHWSVRFFKYIFTVMILTLITLAFWTLWETRNHHLNIVKDPGVAIKIPSPKAAKSRVLLVGEIFWGRYIRDASLKSEQKYAFPFSGLKSFGKDKYDAWLAHMECPITTGRLTSAEQEATLTFNCRPEFLKEASKWFDVLSLANNHTDNMGGQTGLDETRNHLEESGIQHYGHYDNAVKNELCEVVSVPFHISYSSGPGKIKNFPVAMCGFHNVFKLPTEDELDVISDYSKYFLTIVTPQMGKEYVPAADELKTSTYHAMIDRGADMVVATHPHWIQNTELYKNKLIMYSIGNFIFDQQNTIEVRRGAGLDLSIGITNRDDLVDWLNVDWRCSEFGDDCLAKAKAMNLKKPDFKLSYNIVASLNTGYVTSLAPEDVRQGVLRRLNWSSTIKQLTD